MMYMRNVPRPYLYPLTICFGELPTFFIFTGSSCCEICVIDSSQREVKEWEGNECICTFMYIMSKLCRKQLEIKQRNRVFWREPVDLLSEFNNLTRNLNVLQMFFTHYSPIHTLLLDASRAGGLACFPSSTLRAYSRTHIVSQAHLVRHHDLRRQHNRL